MQLTVFRLSNVRPNLSAFLRRVAFSIYPLIFAANLCAQAGPIRNDLDKKYNFDIPANTRLEDALIEWGAKAGMTVMISTPTVELQRTPGVRGLLSARDALATLLRNSGLVYTSEGGRVRVVPSKPLVRSGLWDDDTASQPAVDTDGQTGSLNTDSLQRQGAQNITQSEGRARDLVEVIVTAQKREERLIDVPISIVALSADALEKRNIVDFDDLSMAVPGLALQDTGDQRRITLRGISNIFGSGDPEVGIYLDEASVASTSSNAIDLRLYDLDHVEVLRGPQGTLYGQGSVGGTIRLITKSPVLDQITMTADVSALWTQGGSPSQRVQEALNLPLINDVLGVRIAGTFDHEGGWMNQPTANLTDINDQNLSDLRVKSLWLPVAGLAINGMVVVHRNNETPSLGEVVPGYFAQVGGLTTTPQTQDDYNIFNLTGTYDFPWARLLSSTTYLESNVNQKNWGQTLEVLGPVPPNPYVNAYVPHYEFSNRNLNQELRLTSTNGAPLQWTIGAVYNRIISSVIESPVYESIGPFPSPLPTPLGISASAPIKSGSIFGDVSYKLADRLTIGMGVRYFEENVEQSEQACCSPGAPSSEVPGAKSHSTDPRVYAQFKITDQFSAYASAAKGFRGGGSNGFGAPNFGPEQVWTYELGTKMALLERRLTIDGAIFLSRYDDYQVVGLVPYQGTFVNITSNNGAARIKGIEWDAEWRPWGDWTLSVSGDYLDTAFTSINAGQANYDVGDPIDLTARYQYNGSLEKEFSLAGRRSFARLDYGQQGPETYRLRSIGPWYFSESDVIHMLNFNSGVAWNENLSVGLFAQNLLNDRGYTSPIINERQAARTRPRTYGVNFGVKF